MFDLRIRHHARRRPRCQFFVVPLEIWGIELIHHGMMGAGLGSAMPDWLIKLLEQWGVVKSAPIPFAIAVVGGAAVIWLAISWSYRAVLNGKNAQIELQDRQLADYREKLNGATPAEAKAEIDALKEKVRHTIGDKWPALSATEITSLKGRLASFPKKIRVQIMYENYLGKDLAQSFLEAFKQAGWSSAWLTAGSGLGYGVTVGQGSETAPQVKNAIEFASNLHVDLVRPDQPEIPDLIFLAVGINQNDPRA